MTAPTTKAPRARQARRDSQARRTAQMRGIIRYCLKITVFLLISGAALFLAAGTLNWRAGWIFMGALLLIQVLNALVLIPTSPDLVAERSKFQEGTKGWDRILSPTVAMFGPLAISIIAGLDARFGWTLAFSPLVRWAGIVLVLAGGAFGLWAMYTNAFFSSTVRIQSERGHKVISSGPYRIVRHPGYLGGLLFDLAAPLALGSWWALLPALLTVAAVFLRTALEDRTLQAELPGYRDYARRVRARLLPGIW